MMMKSYEKDAVSRIFCVSYDLDLWEGSWIWNGIALLNYSKTFAQRLPFRPAEDIRRKEGALCCMDG